MLNKPFHEPGPNPHCQQPQEALAHGQAAHLHPPRQQARQHQRHNCHEGRQPLKTAFETRPHHSYLSQATPCEDDQTAGTRNLL